MSLFIFFIAAVTVAAAATAPGANYCDASLCQRGTHIACGHKGKFAATCPKDATIVNFDAELQRLVVDTHNDRRNHVAGGADANHSAACRMGTVQWDDELAALATLNVRQCAMKHDSCRNTIRFKFSGQNLAWMGFREPRNNHQLTLQAMKMWFDEIKNSKMQYIKSYPMNYNGPAIGHFTQMMADRSTKVGCGVATYTEPGAGFKAYLMACNYEMTNIMGQPIYTDCSSPAAGCTTGRNPKYSNLCSPAEVYKRL